MTTDPQPGGNARHASPGEPPVIDAQQLLAPANASAPPPPEVASAIADAASTWGFFQLTNHGMDAAVLHRMTRAMHSFFDLDLETKLQVRPAARSGTLIGVFSACARPTTAGPLLAVLVVFPQARRSETNAMGYAHDGTLSLQTHAQLASHGHPRIGAVDIERCKFSDGLIQLLLPTIVFNQFLAAAELTKQTLDLKEVFDVSRVPHPDLPDTHPLNKTIEGFNLWPPGQVRASALA
jgi:isopenicillin N synthase-like dioxygenase